MSVERPSLVALCVRVCAAPRAVWTEVATERLDVEDIFRRVVVPLSVVGPLCFFARSCFLGIPIPLTGIVATVPLRLGVPGLLVQCLSCLSLPFAWAWVIRSTAPRFGGEIDFSGSFRLAAFSLIPAYLAGSLLVLPVELWPLALLAGAYSAVVYYGGIETISGVSGDSKTELFVVTYGAAVFLLLVLGCLASLLVPGF